MQHMHVRWMIDSDMHEVVEIERLCYLEAWNLDDFRDCRARRNMIAVVAERDGKVIGYLVYELFKAKFHLWNLAVHPAWRRMTVGENCIAYLKAKLMPDRRRFITADVRETSLDAQLFLKAMGFRATKVMRGYFCDNDEDAYHFQYRLAWRSTDDGVDGGSFREAANARGQ